MRWIVGGDLTIFVTFLVENNSLFAWIYEQKPLPLLYEIERDKIDSPYYLPYLHPQ